MHFTRVSATPDRSNPAPPQCVVSLPLAEGCVHIANLDREGSGHSHNYVFTKFGGAIKNLQHEARLSAEGKAPVRIGSTQGLSPFVEFRYLLYNGDQAVNNNTFNWLPRPVDVYLHLEVIS